MPQKITPFLWFEKGAEDAARYYVSVFSGPGDKNSKIIAITHYDKASSEVAGMPVGTVLTVAFTLAGQEFTIINGGKLPPGWTKISGATSFVVNCENQDEVDYFWEKLSEGGESGICGWIYRDKFGVTWQVVPTILTKYLSDPDPEKAKRVMEVMLKMKKIIIADLEKAYQG